MQTIVALCVTALVAVPIAAQHAPAVVKLDVDAGFGGTSGGGARDVPVAFAFGAVAATPLRVRTTSGLVVGVGLHAHWPLDYGTSCIVSVASTGCIPAYPKFTSVAALVGWEAGSRRNAGGRRVLIGPAVFRTDEKNTLFGVLGRLDLSVLQIGHVGLKLWTQGATASPFRNERYLLLSGGVGVRLQ